MKAAIAHNYSERTPELPVDHKVERRKNAFDFKGDDIRNWYGNRVVTRIFDALQSTFPEGERMFIESVRNYESEINDPKLAKDVKDFIYQEAQHGLAHDAVNRALEEQGVNMKGILAEGKRFAKMQKKYFPKKFFLATTAAAEHITATLAETGFNSDWEILGDAPDEIRALFMWHAVEEIEHKAVAWDVYEQVADGDYATRVAAMLTVLAMMTFGTSVITREMLSIENEKVTLEERIGVIKFMWGKKGVLRLGARPLLRYFQPGFHPWKSKRPKNYDVWKKAFEETQDMLAAENAVSMAS